MIAPATLRTERLVLRPFTPADAAAVQRLAGERDVAATTATLPHPYPEGAAAEWIAALEGRRERGEALILAITTPADGVVGAIGLHCAPEHRRAELGYWVGRPFWGRGYATEAARAVVAHGFEQLGLARIHASAMTRNPASSRVLGKIGMKREGRQRAHLWRFGAFEDLDLHGRLASDRPPPGAAASARGPRSREPLALLLATAALLALSAIGPRDRATWWLEVFPILLAAPLLVATARRFPLTPLCYRLIFVHAAILMLGAHYTYAEVPIGRWVQEWLGLARNHYDRVGHVAQGFVPAIVAREILARLAAQRGGWLFFLATAVPLAISALYELIEWWAALIFGAGAEAFLGTQGDPWDTQWDMALALAGAVAAQLLLARIHGRQLARSMPAGASDPGAS